MSAPLNSAPGRSDVGAARPELLHTFLEVAASHWPERVALEVPPGRDRPARVCLTYAELVRRSDILAQSLQALVSGECVVGILLPRTSEHLCVAQLAVLKVGAAYTCLDPTFPDGRIQDILNDAAAVALITDGDGVLRSQHWAITPPPLIDPAMTATTVPSANAPVGICERKAWLGPRSLAYLIYTSGSTGSPKGVMIEHRSIVNLVASDLEAFDLSPLDRVAQGSSPAYDSSIEETWLAFAAGATLVLMDDDVARSGPDLIDWLRQERISVFCPPPTLLRATGCSDPQAALPDLKLLYVGGEALPRDVADSWSSGRTMVNGYGPTECSVTCLRGPVQAGGPINIGGPVHGMTAWVLNDALDEVATAEAGELCIGGIGLARGYWKQPELTAQRFVEHPRLGRIYRTGDLVARDASGLFFYQGRIDAQVKLRGYRIELGEIEARLAQCDGVRAAACHVQHDGVHDVLVAYVVPHDDANPPTVHDMRAALAAVLPAYMVPARFASLEQLPTTVGGKLNRAALPLLNAGSLPVQPADPEADAGAPLPDPLQATITRAFREVLGWTGPLSGQQDFFEDLGGDSLGAALLVTLLREDPATAWITVRDVYEARCVAALAARAPTADQAKRTTSQPDAKRPAAHPMLVTIMQTLWLMALLGAGSVISWQVFAELPGLSRWLGLVPSILLAPVLAMAGVALYAPCALLLAVGVKRLLVGRYQALREPVWGSFYLRNWIVQQVVRLVPWSVLQGTVFQQTALRALGARIGQRVHIHRGVDLLRGGWDLLDIGDDVTLGQDVGVHLVEFDQGDIVLGPVTLRKGATLETRSGVSAHTVVEAGAYLSALSSLPRGARIPQGERWDGIPARCIGSAPMAAPLTQSAPELAPHLHGLALMLGRAVLGLLIALPIEALAIMGCALLDLNAEQTWAWMAQPAFEWRPWLLGMAALLMSVPLTLVWTAVLMRLLGPVAPGTISRWSLAYIRVWLKTGLLLGAGTWLSGTLFWPRWLRWAGMSVGRGCEISTIIDVVPELVDIGHESFFADGIYLGVPHVQQGRVTLARTRLGSNTFLGNHVVVAAGQHWPAGVLVGIATCLRDATPSAASAWFGHPPFELPRREVVEMGRHLTHEPSALRYANRLFWEALRFALPIVPALLSGAWFSILLNSAQSFTRFSFFLLLVPAVTLGAAASLCLLVLALKWALLGRVRPGQHALWSCWASRWDFVYVTWGQYARPVLERLDGTLLLAPYLRAMGMKIGKQVVLGPGFSQVVDPDMIKIDDGATVNAMFQAHTFEDRVLKIDHILIGEHATLGSATVPLYGARIGPGTHVAAHSVIMKRERLAAGMAYEGAPTQAVKRQVASG